MTDPLSILREYTISKKPIIEKDGKIIFGTYSWPKSVKTNYASLIWESEKNKTPYEYYTLETLVFFMKHVDLPHPMYCRKAQAENVPYIRRPDRKRLLNYLKGITSVSKSINELCPNVFPTEVKTEPDKGTNEVYVEEYFSIERSSLSSDDSRNSHSENDILIKTEPIEETNEADTEGHSSNMESTSLSDRNSWSEEYIKIKTEPGDGTNEQAHSSIVVSSSSDNSRNFQSTKSVKTQESSVEELDAELLIENVKAHPEIWKICSEEYKDRKKRDAAWEKISRDMIKNFEEKEDVEKSEIVVEVKRKWKSLRSAYVREKRTNPSGGNKKEWIFMQPLSFLAAHVKEKKKYYKTYSDSPPNDITDSATDVMDFTINLVSNTETDISVSDSNVNEGEEEIRILPSTPIASTSSIAIASPSKRPQEKIILTKNNKRRKVIGSIQKPLEIMPDVLIPKELAEKKSLPQAFSEVLELLLEKVSDSRKVEVMIKLLSVVQEELNKENC